MLEKARFKCYILPIPNIIIERSGSMNEMLRRDIDKFAEENREALFRDIARLVAVDSVEGEPLPDAPFGKGPAKALALALEISRELGLEAVNCENMIGYAAVGLSLIHI